MAFRPDDLVRQAAEAYSLDAVDFAREHFRVSLDWSDGSVERLEKILDTFHRQLGAAKPSDDQIMGFAKMFGSYVGEVFRRHHGATWGIVSMGDETYPGMHFEGPGGEFWPWARVRNRIVNGAEDNVWHYFQTLVGESGTQLSIEQPKPSSWWSKVFGSTK